MKNILIIDYIFYTVLSCHGLQYGVCNKHLDIINYFNVGIRLQFISHNSELENHDKKVFNLFHTVN